MLSELALVVTVIFSFVTMLFILSEICKREKTIVIKNGVMNGVVGFMYEVTFKYTFSRDS